MRVRFQDRKHPDPQWEEWRASWPSKRTRVQNRWACSGSFQSTGKRWLFRASWPSSEAIGRLWRIHTFPSAMAHSMSCGRAKACSAAIANCAMRHAQSFGKHSACRCEPATGLRIRPACRSSVKRASFSTVRRSTTARSPRRSQSVSAGIDPSATPTPNPQQALMTNRPERGWTGSTEKHTPATSAWMAGWINTPMPSEEWFWWRASRAATAAGLGVRHPYCLDCRANVFRFADADHAAVKPGIARARRIFHRSG